MCSTLRQLSAISAAVCTEIIPLYCSETFMEVMTAVGLKLYPSASNVLLVFVKNILYSVSPAVSHAAVNCTCRCIQPADKNKTKLPESDSGQLCSCHQNIRTIFSFLTLILTVLSALPVLPVRLHRLSAIK